MLPEYQCHKVVKAGEIIDVMKVADKQFRVHLKGTGEVRLIISLPTAMTVRHEPVKGDYYVVYDDGYASISPRHAFKAGYDII
jgi:hypothetical protein